MKILILTTKTIHHKYFTKVMIKNFKNIFTIYEKKRVKFPFKTSHLYEKKRDIYEKKIFFSNKEFKNNNLRVFNDVNNNATIKYIKKIKPRIIIAFGIGLLKKKFLSSFKNLEIINLHGGNPEQYRGLDSILWSLYHKDFKNLFTTLHFVEEKFDTGKIISKLRILINKKTKFEHLRAINTINCCNLVIKYLRAIQKEKKIPAKKQLKVGRYYSAIPSCLIDICEENFYHWKKKNEK